MAAAARARQPDLMRLIGVLMPYADGDTCAQSLVAAFRAALAKLGWMDGSNLRIELRWGASDEDRFKSFAKELARQLGVKCDGYRVEGSIRSCQRRE
jgi:putative tryptophan/tyrosine transport system substrate-binding protein